MGLGGGGREGGGVYICIESRRSRRPRPAAAVAAIVGAL